MERVKTSLTEEQFNELPEILYEPPEDCEDENENEDEAGGNTEAPGKKVSGEASADNEEEQNELEEVDIRLDAHCEQPKLTSVLGQDNGKIESTKPETSLSLSEQSSSAMSMTSDSEADGETAENDSEEVVRPPAELVSSKTTCTMCSICIDDFERGERLTFLPRCQHAFHRDCIHPWLTGRQGCCPLCKTNVREEFDHMETDSDENNPDANEDSNVDPESGDSGSAGVSEEVEESGESSESPRNG